MGANAPRLAGRGRREPVDRGVQDVGDRPRALAGDDDQVDLDELASLPLEERAHTAARGERLADAVVAPRSSRAVTDPDTVSSSPSSTGSTNLTLAVPRSSHPAPNASTSGRVM